MARYSKTLLSKTFTGSSDFESYVSLFELLSQLLEVQRKETVKGAETQNWWWTAGLTCNKDQKKERKRKKVSWVQERKKKKNLEINIEKIEKI